MFFKFIFIPILLFSLFQFLPLLIYAQNYCDMCGYEFKGEIEEKTLRVFPQVKIREGCSTEFFSSMQNSALRKNFFIWRSRVKGLKQIFKTFYTRIN